MQSSGINNNARPWDKIISSVCPRVACGNKLITTLTPGTYTTDYFVPGPIRSLQLSPTQAVRNAVAGQGAHDGLGVFDLAVEHGVDQLV